MTMWGGPSEIDRPEPARDPATPPHTREDGLADLALDAESNQLEAGVGDICPVCHEPIKAGQGVRRRVDGQYQHDSC